MSSEPLPQIPPAVRWQGWRRPRKGEWAKVEGTLCDQRMDCHQRLMRIATFTGGEDVECDYRVLPEGEYPRDETMRRQMYRDKQMRNMGDRQ